MAFMTSDPWGVFHIELYLLQESREVYSVAVKVLGSEVSVC